MLRRVGTTVFEWTGVRAAFSDGQGSYLLAVLLLSAAALFLHRAMTPEWKYHDALRDLLMVRQEPFRGENHPVLSTAVLSGAAWDACKEPRLLISLDKIQRSFTEAVRNKRPDPRARSWPECRDESCPPATGNLGYSKKDDAPGNSRLMISSTVAPVLDNAPDCPDGATCGVQAASAVLEASRILGPLWDGREQLPERMGSLRAAYFIDLLGNLRYVSSVGSREFTIPADRTFAGGNAVYKALAQQELCPEFSPGDDGPSPTSRPFRTLPYLDVFGLGVVETLCYAIDRGGRSVGTLCFDITPPEAVLQEALEHANWLFDLHVLQHIGQHPHDEFVRCTAPCLDGPPQLSEEEMRMVRRVWNHAPDPGAAGFSAVRIFGEHDDYFGATISWHTRDPRIPGDRDYELILIGRLVRSVTHDVAAAVAATLFALAAGSVLAAGLRRKARRLDVTLIRGLQVGVVEVDETDEIIAANDRSEEILGTHLPRFGDPRGSVDARLFCNQIESDVVLLDDDGELPDQVVRFSPYREIEQQRRSGHTGSYYAFTKVHQQWIRASGSTIVKPGRRHHTFAMLDTYVDKAHLAKLIAARVARGRPS